MSFSPVGLDAKVLSRLKLAADQLIDFLAACRCAYNNFVPFHNFRHVVDVLQATFHFLVQIRILPPYPESTQPKPVELGATPLETTERGPGSPDLTRSQTTVEEKFLLTSMLSPFEALTLLITAIGHDAGHPGVNNGFLISLNAPLAQLYNDRSVLESFHCAAYSQILRRYWPSAFEDAKMRSLMISSILATDMGLHFEYMKKMGDAQANIDAKAVTDGWNGRQTEEHKALACSLLIKCADISNVVSSHFP